MKSSKYYFHIKKKILVDFQICISVPLMALVDFTNNQKTISGIIYRGSIYTLKLIKGNS